MILIMITLLHFFFFFNDTATTEIYTLSLHDALPISPRGGGLSPSHQAPEDTSSGPPGRPGRRRTVHRFPRQPARGLARDSVGTARPYGRGASRASRIALRRRRANGLPRAPDRPARRP